MNDVLFDLVCEVLAHSTLTACHIDASIYTVGDHKIIIDGSNGFIGIDEYTIGQMTTEQQNSLIILQTNLYREMENKFIIEFKDFLQKIPENS
jgi:hypothetical protein